MFPLKALGDNSPLLFSSFRWHPAMFGTPWPSALLLRILPPFLCFFLPCVSMSKSPSVTIPLGFRVIFWGSGQIWILRRHYLTPIPINRSILLLTTSSTYCSVQFSHSVVSDSATPWTAAHQASLSIANYSSLLKLRSIESAMSSNHLILCRPLLFPPSIFLSIRVFSSESVLCIRWPKYWSFSCSISPFNDYSGLISFRRDWLDLLAVQETLKSLLQHHSSKGSILEHSPFFIVQLSHPYMTTGKTIALTKWTFVGKVMSLLNIVTVYYSYWLIMLPFICFTQKSTYAHHFT